VHRVGYVLPHFAIEILSRLSLSRRRERRGKEERKKTEKKRKKRRRKKTERRQKRRQKTRQKKRKSTRELKQEGQEKQGQPSVDTVSRLINCSSENNRCNSKGIYFGFFFFLVATALREF
jgi:Flp pilus assembly protein TadB